MKKIIQHYILLTFFFLLFFCQNNSLQAQNRQRVSQSDLINLQELIENLAEDNDDANIDYDTFFERLSDYLERPLNLNKATFEDLSGLPILTPQQAQAIINYRDRMGDFIAVYELQAVPELDMNTIRKIAPFVRAKNLENFNATFKELFSKGTHRVFLRYRRVLEEQKGYQFLDTLYGLNIQKNDSLGAVSNVFVDGDDTDTLLTNNNYTILDTTSTEPFRTYKGSPDHLYLRYRYNWGNKISYGITAEKDPGEQFFRGTQKQGFDFYSAHFYIRDLGRFKHLSLGDYEIHFGQGLVVWTGLGFRKGSFVMNVLKQGNPIRAYTSVNEALYFRGAAATLALSEKLEFTAFGSYKKNDANSIVVTESVLEDDQLIENESNVISSLQASGLHRTLAETLDKGSINKTDIGGNLSFKSRRFSIGASAMYTRLSSPLVVDDNLYNLYRFSGDRLLNGSIDYKFLYRNFNFFGETAMSDNGGLATVNGVLMGLDPKVSVSVVHRYYDKKYQSLHYNSFGESTRPQNETGLFIGTVISPLAPFKTWELTGYVDVYRHPWLRSQIDAPSSGTDYLLQAAYRPSRRMNMYVRYRNEIKQRNGVGNEAFTDFLTDHKRSSLRYDLRFKVNKAITLKSRIEMSWYNTDNANPESTDSRGYMMLQDLVYQPLSSPFSLSTRIALFETDNYNARIYAYENDLPYTFNVPPYYNRGTRFYIMGRYNVVRGVSTWIRFSQTYFADQQTFSGGNEEIGGNIRSDIKAMVRFKF